MRVPAIGCHIVFPAGLLWWRMAEQIIREILHPSGSHRVIIVRRGDGRFTYRRQKKDVEDWSPATIDAGVYDSVDTAEMEARQRVAWLREQSH